MKLNSLLSLIKNVKKSSKILKSLKKTKVFVFQNRTQPCERNCMLYTTSQVPTVSGFWIQGTPKPPLQYNHPLGV